MAAWQVEFYVVPRRAIAGAAQPLTRSVLAETRWWSASDLPEDYDRLLSAVGAASDAAPALAAWGPVDGNRVEVQLENGLARSMRVFVDVRRLDSKFGAAVIL